MAFWGPIASLINLYYVFPFPLLATRSLSSQDKDLPSRAGAGGGEVGRRPGPQSWGTGGLREGLLRAIITARRLGGVSVLQGESGKGDTLWPMSHGLYNTPGPSEMVTGGRHQPRTP